MIKVKEIFDNSKYDAVTGERISGATLDQNINNFIKELSSRNVVDVKYQVGCVTKRVEGIERCDPISSALIIYEERLSGPENCEN